MSTDDDDSTRILPSQAPKPASTPQRTEIAPQRTEIAPPPEAYNPDGDATVIRPRPPPAPPRPAANDGGNMLPVGFYLGEFEIVKVLGEGGFGIVYLADDHSLGRRVALKEYMPSSLAQRVGGTQVSVKSERHRETFEAGLKSFVNEARLLAQFDHPSLVKVYRFWEANGTAYMVMPFYEGITLKDELKAMGAPPDEAWLRDLLEPLTEALAVIHTEQCFHRDIAPDNVILLKGSNRPLLLDFGAARRVIGDMTQALTVILKPGYAPVEQYAEVPGMKQGPWTDVYALAAVVYYAITGKTPPTSVGRLMNDNYVPMVQAGEGRYSPAFLEAIDRALVVKPEQRTQSIDDLRHDLGMAPSDPDSGKTKRGRGPATMAGALPAGAAAARKSRTGMFAAIGVVALLVVGGGLFFALSGKPAAPVATTAATPPVATAPTTAAPVTPASTVPVVAAATPTLPSGSVVSPPAAGPFDPTHEFERVVAAQSAAFKVEAAADKPQLKIDKDNLTFKVKTEKEGYLYVLQYGSDGGIVQVFPNTAAKSNRLKADSTTSLPPKNALTVAAGPPGMDHLLVIVSNHPRQFRALGMKNIDGFEQTTLEAARLAAEAAGPAASVFAGTPVCTQPCSDEYGATQFTVEEIK
ncbi:MAG: protein kinase [Burkholderiales bacterium]|nr:protein kinase [Burkholderiales bacterium]